MRGIKFRAWDGYTVFNVDVLAIGDCSWDCPDHGKRGVSLAYQPHIKVMQYTCLNDKNDVGIYEGDIIKHKYYDGFQEVFYSDSLLAYRLSPADVFIQRADEDMGLIEVIGNIYATPELSGRRNQNE